jgi:imidazolonepropionase
MANMNQLLIKNIKYLVQVREPGTSTIPGSSLSYLPTIENAFLCIEDGVITDYGGMDHVPSGIEHVINADGGAVLPSFCDSHTHLVYADSRENEFVDRIKGLSYEEIAANGGGILNSAARLQHVSEEHLFESAFRRLKEVISFGTGAIEIKSGYGLSVEGELKMLRVIKQLKNISPIPIKANFLGAHAIPTKYKNDRPAYIELIIDQMLPIIAKEKLADYIDVFCDKGFFTPEETGKILLAGKSYGLKPKIHANELAVSGGVQIGVAHQAISVDHLECIGEEEIKVLQNSDTIPTLLPSTAFFLGIPVPPARMMIEGDLPVALASDYNPGSSPSGNMPFILALACITLKMLPAEAINAATINAAAAMELLADYGSITKGKVGSVIITKPIPSIAYLPYAFGSDWIEKVVIKGSILHQA